MKKWIRLLCLVLALVIAPAAMAAPRMPQRRGTVTDDADVLGAQTAADFEQYAARVEEETGLRIHAALVHFLDGLDVQAYADQLFAKWELEAEDVLLLIAAAEDSVAAAMGSHAADQLGKAENLLYTSSECAGLVRSQQYDAAVAAYCRAVDAVLVKRTGESRIDSLFGTQVQPAADVQHYASRLWDDVMQTIESAGTEAQERYEEREKQDNGISAGGWMVLIILIVILMRQQSRRKARRTGCGCSPLGWLFSLLGLGFLLRRK